jgi:hypothetical protein
MSTNQVDIRYFRYQQQYCDFPWQYPTLRNVFLLGGYGCVDGDTLLDTPKGKVKIRDFKGGWVLSFNEKESKLEFAWASPSVEYKPTSLYKVTLKNGKEITCTDKHKFYAPTGWVELEDILKEDKFLFRQILTEEKEAVVYSRIKSVHFVKQDSYYDLTVPENHSYVGNGIVNHNCGKTHADRNMLWNIYKRYHNYPVEVIVAGVTITLVRKTLVKMFLQLLNECKIPYKDNSKLNCIQVDKMYFYVLGMDQPENIFAYNGSIFLADELDELPQDVAIEAFEALQERTRIMLPDGRGPFGCISTTAQGLKGVYRITESLKEKNRKYCIIRGSTKENTTLSPDYVENLESIYDENEKQAYLEGKFINLSSGRVYGNYDEALNMWRGEPIAISPTETIYVGQDFNAGFNKAVAVVDRSGELVAVKEFSFKQIGDAPTVLRATFPENRIVWFPDASGKELLAGYAMEIRRAKIELRFANFNPSIVERIFFVNKLFKTQRLWITSDCKELAIALKTRQFDDTGKPEKGKGEKAVDHVCFVGDTLVTMRTGDKPIRDIRVGEYVLTRKGYKKVAASACTGIVEAFQYNLNGIEVGSTKEHPVWTTEGFTAIGSLHKGHTICTLAFFDFAEERLRENTEPVSLGVQPVYNLTVEDEHEYFANGILVSNCDSFEYVLYRLVFWLPYFRDLLKASPEKDTRSGKYIAGAEA